MPPDRAPQTFNPELATQEIADLEAAVFRHRDNKRLQQNKKSKQQGFFQ